MLFLATSFSLEDLNIESHNSQRSHHVTPNLFETSTKLY